MLKSRLISISIILLFISCKKNNTCVCTVSTTISVNTGTLTVVSHPTVTTVDYKMRGTQQNRASKCELIQDASSDMTCVLETK